MRTDARAVTRSQALAIMACLFPEVSPLPSDRHPKRLEMDVVILGSQHLMPLQLTDSQLALILSSYAF
jgi:hypothetical protein